VLLIFKIVQMANLCSRLTEFIQIFEEQEFYVTKIK
jgi:hypothetical protein